MILGSVLSPSPSSTQQSSSTETQSTEPTTEEESGSTTTSATPSESRSSSEKLGSVPAQEAESAASVPKASVAETEEFARAAAQRSIDSARTRALIDGISPVNNSGVQAAKSYLTPVEPKAPAEEGNASAAAEKAPLDKAA